jgi:hypothetical protein
MDDAVEVEDPIGVAGVGVEGIEYLVPRYEVEDGKCGE